MFEDLRSGVVLKGDEGSNRSQQTDLLKALQLASKNLKQEHFEDSLMLLDLYGGTIGGGGLTCPGFIRKPPSFKVSFSVPNSLKGQESPVFEIYYDWPSVVSKPSPKEIICYTEGHTLSIKPDGSGKRSVFTNATEAVEKALAKN